MPRLRIVSVNDVYTLETMPRLATLVAKRRAQDPADVTLVIMAGDFLAPSMLSSLDSGAGMIDCLNAIGFTHVCFGNHEDDVALAELQKRVADFKGKWLDSNAHALDDSLPKFDIVNVGAAKVALLGVVMTDPSVYRGVAFGSRGLEPANAVVLRDAAKFVDCAAVIPITHQPMDDDRALAAAGKFPLIVGGHEHVPFIEQIGPTFIVKSGMDAQRACVVDLVWPEDASQADLPVVTVTLEPVADHAEDPEMRARVDGHMIKVRELETSNLFDIEEGTTLSSIGTRRQQTTLGTLICTTLRDTLLADAAVFNGGGIRASHTYLRHFTYADLKAEVPFDNEVVCVRMPGRVLMDAVAMSRAHAPEESGGYLQVDEGMQVDANHRVLTIDNEPIDPNREYVVATVRNFFDGLDHIEPFARFGEEHPERIPDRDSGRDAKHILVEAFALAIFRRLPPFDVIDANHDGRISRAELEEAIARATHTKRSPVIANLVMSAVDTNKDDTISAEEAAAARHGNEPKPKR